MTATDDPTTTTSDDANVTGGLAIAPRQKRRARKLNKLLSLVWCQRLAQLNPADPDAALWALIADLRAAHRRARLQVIDGDTVKVGGVPQ